MLTYIGKGAFDPRFPARDLTTYEVAQYGKETLLATGLYQEPSEKKSAQTPKNKEV